MGTKPLGNSGYYMSKIDDQIRELQLRKTKIEFLEHILKSAQDYDHVGFKEVKEEVVSRLEKFVNDSIEEIESGVSGSNGSSGELTQEDIQVVKMLAQKAKNKINNTTTRTPPAQPKQKPVADPNDKLNFALNNRHLADKRVSVANNENMQVHGKVVGLDAPNVIVKTDTGPTIEVPITNISLLS